MVVKYVRVPLFPKVKFLYDEEKDLRMGGKIYLDFVNKISKEPLCKRRPDGESDWNFLAHLWNGATASKIQKRAINLKRSAVYTVMQNKFAGEFVFLFTPLLQIDAPCLFLQTYVIVGG